MLKTLKAQNATQLGALILAALLIAYTLTYGIEPLLDFNNRITELGGAALLSVVCVWFAYLLPAEWKHGLLYLRVKNSLPAHRFLTLVDGDPRLSKESLFISFPQLEAGVDAGAEQNTFWYRKIYQPVRDAEIVQGVHKPFLLYRDATASLLIVALLLSGLCFWGAELMKSAPVMSTHFIAIVWVQVLLLGIAAHNCGKRFVTTAITEYLNCQSVSSSQR